MVPECLTLLREWAPEEDQVSFQERVVRENLIGKTTRSRVRDFLNRIFFRRFSPPAAGYLHQLIEACAPERELRLLMLYQTALADDLLYDFITQHLFDLLADGRIYLDTGDAVSFLERLTAQGAISPPWSEQNKLKTGRGLLAACRDFGLLEGHNRKQFSHLVVSQRVFLYVAYSLHDKGVAPALISRHPDWRLFFLEESDVERLFFEAHQAGDIHYEAAGGIKRIDWTWTNLGGLVRRLAEGTY